MLTTPERPILGKIARAVRVAVDERSRAGTPALVRSARLAAGRGWEAADVICTAGPDDRVFDEQHAAVSVAVVVAGSFQYRTHRGLHLMTPGSLFLGNPGECYACSHEHGPGDRCLAFRFTPAFMDQLAAELGARRTAFGASRLPPMRESAGVVAAIATTLAGGIPVSWEETAIDVAVAALQGSQDKPRTSGAPRRDALERVTHVVREIEREPAADRQLHTLAADAELSTFQLLRQFRRLTGTTPHQYLLRARLREAAASLRTTEQKIVEIALGCGFNDLSNFNHAFRAEFGATPRAYRSARNRSLMTGPRPPNVTPRRRRLS